MLNPRFWIGPPKLLDPSKCKRMSLQLLQSYYIQTPNNLLWRGHICALSHPLTFFILKLLKLIYMIVFTILRWVIKSHKLTLNGGCGICMLQILYTKYSLKFYDRSYPVLPELLPSAKLLLFFNCTESNVKHDKMLLASTDTRITTRNPLSIQSHLLLQPSVLQQ